MFSCEFVDKDVDEIQCVVFNLAVGKFNPIIKQNRVYSISNAEIRIADRRYSAINNQYSMSLRTDSEVIQLEVFLFNT